MTTGVSPRRDHGRVDRTTAVTDQHGFTIVIVALTMTLMVTITAIVIDLGSIYATHRQVQNAVDAAAMAASRQLAKGATGGTILATAQTVAAANGADSSSVVCQIIANTLTPTPFPFLTSGGNPLTCAAYTNHTDYPTADGVWITASKTNNTFFGGVVNASTLSTSAVAAATAQPLRSINAPLFAACGDDQEPDVNATPAAKAPSLLLDTNGNPPDPTNNPSPALPLRINPNAIYSASADRGRGGPVYEVEGPHATSCGAISSSNKGLLSAPVSVWGGSPPTSSAGWNDQVSGGVKSGSVRPAVANQPGCDLSSSVGCVMLFPVCDSAVGSGNGVNYRCEFFGSFQLVKANTNTDDVAFLGPVDSEAAYGAGSQGAPQTNEEYVIKLVI